MNTKGPFRGDGDVIFEIFGLELNEFWKYMFDCKKELIGMKKV